LISDNLQKLLNSIQYQIEDEGQRIIFVKRIAKALLEQLEKIDEESSDETLIEYLMAKGLFPTFAFPLDVAMFEAKGTKKKKENSKYSDPHTYARTSQDLKVALSEYAPGRRIVINKQSFLVNGIGKRFPENPIHHLGAENFSLKHYDEGTGEIIEVAKKWTFYNRCMSENCGVVFQSTAPDFATDDSNTCQACKAAGRDSDVQGTRIHKPEVFRPLVIPHSDGVAMFGNSAITFTNSSEKEMRARDDSEEAGTRTRTSSAKLPTPLNEIEAGVEEMTVVRDVEDGDYSSIHTFLLGPDDELFEGTRLLITNNGPKEHGFSICDSCGYVPLDGKYKSHQRPYAITREDIRNHVTYNEKLTGDDHKNRVKELLDESKSICNGKESQPIILGHEFRTDVVVFRVPIREPLTTDWNTNAFHSALKAIREALITETTNQLKLVEREISGNYRKVTLPDNEGKLHMHIDFFLYDSASGGAGLVRQVTSEKAVEIFEAVEKRLDGHKCTNKIPCDRVCTGCLLDFRNQVDQESMSRVLGNQMFQFFKEKTTPNFNNTGYISMIDPIEYIIESMQSIYTHLTFSKKTEEIIHVLNNTGVERQFEMQSILCGTSEISGDRILWVDTPSRIDDLGNSVVVLPYELIRDAPHMLSEILFPSPPEPEEDSELGGGWL
jgi:hypothetical protein